MAEILTFPTPPSRPGAVRAALEAIPAGVVGKSGGVGEAARQMARHTVTHHRLDAIATQCAKIYGRAARPRGDVIPFPRQRSSGDA